MHMPLISCEFASSFQSLVILYHQVCCAAAESVCREHMNIVPSSSWMDGQEKLSLRRCAKIEQLTENASYWLNIELVAMCAHFYVFMSMPMPMPVRVYPVMRQRVSISIC